MNVHFSLIYWSLIGAIIWTALESISRRNDEHKRPTPKTYATAAILGVVLGSLLSSYYGYSRTITSVLNLFAAVLAYFVMDIANTLSVIVRKKRL